MHHCVLYKGSTGYLIWFLRFDRTRTCIWSCYKNIRNADFFDVSLLNFFEWFACNAYATSEINAINRSGWHGVMEVVKRSNLIISLKNFGRMFRFVDKVCSKGTIYFSFLKH
jgi:hypothetical protein